MKYRLILLLITFFTFGAVAQKKPLDHSVYAKWSTIGGYQITDNGKYATYYASLENGDGTFNIVDIKDNKVTSFSRGTNAKLTKDGKFICFIIKPPYAAVKQSKDKKLKGFVMPKDTLAIVVSESKNIVKIPFLKKFEMAKEGSEYIAFQTSPPADTSKAKATKIKLLLKVEKGIGEPLMIFNLESHKIDTLKYVTDFRFNKKGDKLCVVQTPSVKDTLLKTGIFIYDLKTKLYQSVIEGNSKYGFTMPAFSEDEKAMAFYANSDTTKKIEDNVEIYVYKDGYDKAKLIVSNASKGLNKDWQISKYRSLSFSKDNKRLFFAIAPILPKKDTTINDADIAKLDVWTYNDKYLQPQQKLKVNMEVRRSFLSQISVDNPLEIIQLATPEYPIVRVGNKWSTDWGYALTSEKYAIQSQWQEDPINDLYILSIKDGKAKLIQEGEYISSVDDSPDGKYLAWYNNQKKNWYIYDVEKDEIRNVTETINVPLWNELSDTPQMANAYGSGTWGEKDEAFFIYDKYDIWQIDPKGVKPPFMVTDGIGRKEGKTFRQMDFNKLQLPQGTPGITLDPLKKYESLYFTAFDNVTKGYGYYEKNMKAKNPALKQLIMEPDFTLGYFNKAKNANVITFSKSNFSVSPDMWVTKDMFKTAVKISDVNPQQKEYNWGTCEQVKWNSRDGKELEGLLYKPENFDPTKKYPMVVYFYERTSQYKNTYRAPATSRSTINVTYFASNGYLVFMPDIYYKVGHPGQSSMDCIIPGVEKLCENSWVDKNNIGIQGQSWGGYQVAYIVTQTGMFKVAGAGAPVANMTSAYGGIRWGEGVSRQFQYEQTQSRIGKTLWDKGGLELYIENSPLFHADKITTPLLIMDNDDDECVPWYQGIELFTAMKRLGKVVWMLQYNEEGHNIRKEVNALDYTKRLYQFFDYYLKSKPMPVWMKNGIPAVQKGIEWGLDLVPEEKILTTTQIQEKS